MHTYNIQNGSKMDKKYFPKRVFIKNRILFAEQILNWLQYHTLLLPLLLPLAHIGMVRLQYLFNFYFLFSFFHFGMVSWQYLNSAVDRVDGLFRVWYHSLYLILIFHIWYGDVAYSNSTVHRLCFRHHFRCLNAFCASFFSIQGMT